MFNHNFIPAEKSQVSFHSFIFFSFFSKVLNNLASQGDVLLFIFQLMYLLGKRVAIALKFMAVRRTSVRAGFQLLASV